MVGLISLKTPIIHLLFQRGHFDSTATAMTAKALFFYAIGLWAIAGVRTIVPVFYSLQDTWTPFKIALICLGVKVALNCILILPLKHAGLAFATSLASILNFTLLVRKLQPRVGSIDTKRTGRALLQISLCSLLMGLLAYFVCSGADWTRTGHSGEKILLLGAGIGAGLGGYLICSYWMRNEELLFLLRMFKGRK